MKKLLVGVDFTEADDRLIETITSLPNKNDVAITLIHCIPPLSQWIGCYFAYVPQEVVDRKEEKAAFEEKLKAMQTRVEEAGLTTDTLMIEAHPGPGMVDHANAGGYHQIMVGTHSKNMVERALLGSAVDHIVRKSSVPVLVVPTM